MSKQGGLGDNLYIGGYDLSGDVGSLDQISGGPALLDVTPINVSANVRIGGLRSGDLQFTSYFDNASGAEHPALSMLPKTDTIVTYYRGTTLGNPAVAVNGKQINYDLTRDNTGNLTAKVEVQSNGYGLEWGNMLTPGLRTDTTATAGTAYDSGAAGTHGAQAYLQVTAFTGTSVDVSVQHATTSGGSYTSLIDFGSITGIGSYRGTATGTVDEFLKAVTGTGTFTSITFSLMVVVNRVAVSF